MAWRRSTVIGSKEAGGEWPAVWSIASVRSSLSHDLIGVKLVSHIPERSCQLNKRGATIDPPGAKSSLDV